MDLATEKSRQQRQHLIHMGIVVCIGILCILIVIIDLTTGWWGETVIISGMAAGLVTYLLTTLIVDRIIHHDESEQWSPVTRLAITKMLRTLSLATEQTDASGANIPRSLEAPEHFDEASIMKLRQEVVQERDELSDALSSWSGFLATAANVQSLLIALAEVDQELDDVRVAINRWIAASPADKESAAMGINNEMYEYNTQVAHAVDLCEHELKEL